MANSAASTARGLQAALADAPLLSRLRPLLQLLVQCLQHLFPRGGHPGKLLELAKCLVREHDMPADGLVPIGRRAHGQWSGPRIINDV